jgi:hypothetical protein
MYVLVVALSKVSILRFLKALAVSKIHRNVIEVSMYTVIAWAISVFFTLAFQCGASRPWASLTGQCIYKVNIYLSYQRDTTESVQVCVLGCNLPGRPFNRGRGDTAPNFYDDASTSNVQDEISSRHSIFLPRCVRLSIHSYSSYT